MFASLASNRRQTTFRLRADLLDRLGAVFDEPNDETLAAMKEADNLTKVDMPNYESFLKSLNERDSENSMGSFFYSTSHYNIMQYFAYI